MKLYHYNDDGLYLRTTDARVSPLEPDVYLFPRKTTDVRPPTEVLTGDKLGYWIGNSWSSLPLSGGPQDDPQADELRAAILSAIDTYTATLVETGFVYGGTGQSVRLNLRDQTNFEGEKNMYVELLADGLVDEVAAAFPLEVKTGTDHAGAPEMMAIADLGEYKAFVYAGKAYIRATLDAGWALKRQVPQMTIEQLKEWTDPRTASV